MNRGAIPPVHFFQIAHFVGPHHLVWGWPHLPHPRLSLISTGFPTLVSSSCEFFTKHLLSETHQKSYSLKKASIVTNVFTIFSKAEKYILFIFLIARDDSNQFYLIKLNVGKDMKK